MCERRRPPPGGPCQRWGSTMRVNAKNHMALLAEGAHVRTSCSINITLLAEGAYVRTSFSKHYLPGGAHLCSHLVLFRCRRSKIAAGDGHVNRGAPDPTCNSERRLRIVRATGVRIPRARREEADDIVALPLSIRRGIDGRRGCAYQGPEPQL